MAALSHVTDHSPLYSFYMNPLIKVNNQICYIDIPHKMFNIEFGARMTVIQLNDGLVLHSPVPIDSQAKTAISNLGEVKYIIAPNKFHHLFVNNAQENFPSAKTLISPGLDRKRPDLKFDQVLPDCEFSKELKPILLSGWDQMNETVFYHYQSKCLICTDLVEEFDHTKPFFTRLYAKVMGFYEKPSLSKPLRFAIQDKKLFRKSLEEILDLEIDTIIPAHGKILKSGNSTLRSAYSWLSV